MYVDIPPGAGGWGDRSGTHGYDTDDTEDVVYAASLGSGTRGGVGVELYLSIYLAIHSVGYQG